MNTVYISNAHLFDHGCRNYAVADDNGDGTATVTQVDSCHSCWQVGHDQDYEFLKVGQKINLSDWADCVIPEEDLRLPA